MTMPELPEVETVRQGLDPFLRGHRFVKVEQRRKDLRFPLPDRFAERLTGRTVRAARSAREIHPPAPRQGRNLGRPSRHDRTFQCPRACGRCSRRQANRIGE